MVRLASVFPFVALSIGILAGCGSAPAPTTSLLPQRSSGIGGRVRGGQQPIVGAVMQLFAVGTAGDRSAATPLLTQTVLSAADGSFNLTGLYHCDPSDFLYLTSSGGDPGLSAATANPNAVLMAALGPCANLTSSLTILLNEVTTVAAVYALAPYMASPGSVGYDAASHNSLATSFHLAAQLVNISTGAAPGFGIPAGFSPPISRINTLSNILAACINSAGGVSGDGTPCGTLFALTNPAANDTVSALLAIAQNPTLNTSRLYDLPPPNSPFQPFDAIQPTDLSVALIPSATGSVLPGASVQIPFSEGSGTVAHDLSGNHNDCTFGPGANAPAWTPTGIDHLSPGVNNGTPRFCVFPPSATLTDFSEANSRTKTWCGYLRPITVGMQNVGYSILLGGSRESGIGALWMSGRQFANAAYYAGSYAGFGARTSSSDSIVGWHCVTMTLGSVTDATSDRFFYDTTEVANYDSQGATWDYRAAGDYDTLGHTPWLLYGFFEGITSYLLEYPAVLTPTQIAANSQALQSSVFDARGVGPVPPQSLSTTSQIVCNGDSITNETPGAVSYCNELTGLNKSFQVTNLGHGGSTQLTMVSNIPLAEGVLFAPYAPHAFASMAGGINDININSGSALSVFKLRVQWAKRVAAIGWTPLWLTMPSARDGDDTIVQAVNTSLRAAAAGLGVTLVDVATDPCLGATGAFANPGQCNDFTDGIHPNQAGEDSIRNSYVNVINYLTGATAAAPTLVQNAAYQLQPADAATLVSPAGAASTITLPSCVGFSSTTPFLITNGSSTAAVMVVSPSGQLLNGAASAISLAHLATISIVATPLSPSVGGCAWVSN